MPIALDCSWQSRNPTIEQGIAFLPSKEHSIFFLFFLQEEKAKLLAAVQESKRGGTASQTKVAELQETIESLK